MLNEADTKAQFIDPLLRECGWDNSRVRREVTLTEGRIIDSKGTRKPGKRADYVLYNPTVGGIPLAVVEAKDEAHTPSDGMQQAKEYALLLGASFAYASNGHGIEEFDIASNMQKTVSRYPAPSELVQRYAALKLGQKELRPLEIPYFERDKKTRYYQEAAIKDSIEFFLLGKKRILLTMATGTGKTFVAFQIVWKLYKAKAIRRVLYVTDRIFLRGQAYNTFEPFSNVDGGDAREIIEEGRTKQTRDIYFATYQSLYSELDGGKRAYESYPADFFDLVIVDECHRSGFGTWQSILKHFSKAVHLGMTATPKRDDNIDTYNYFGDPAYSYSLGQGIDDGFLAPYKIHKIHTNVDVEGGISLSLATAQGASVIIPDDADAKDFYTVGEFEQKITIPGRTKKICQHLSDLMYTYGAMDKTMVFCVSDEHASDVTKGLQNHFAHLGYADYAVRIVATESDAETLLERFSDSEKKTPVVATTVDLLSTGVDIPSVKNIVMLKPISSKVLFKQIIGRGSRVDPLASKFEFRIIDYVNATRLFDEWDFPEGGDKDFDAGPRRFFLRGSVVDRDTGEKVPNASITVRLGPNEQAATRADGDGKFSIAELPNSVTLRVSARGYIDREKVTEAFDDNDQTIILELRKQQTGSTKIIVDGISVYIKDESSLELLDGRTVSKAEYIQYSKREVQTFVLDLKDLRKIWTNETERENFLNELKQRSVSPLLLADLLGRPDADMFDVIAHVTFGVPVLTRDERAEAFLNLKSDFISSLGPNAKGVLLALLNKYKLGGIENVSADAFELPPFDKMGYILGAAKAFGGLGKLKTAIEEVQRSLYSEGDQRRE